MPAEPAANYPGQPERVLPERQKRNRKIQIWTTETLDDRIRRRCGDLPHRPTVSSWCALVLERELDRIDREKAQRAGQ